MVLLSASARRAVLGVQEVTIRKKPASVRVLDNSIALIGIGRELFAKDSEQQILSRGAWALWRAVWKFIGLIVGWAVAVACPGTRRT